MNYFRTFTQTPREVRQRNVNFECWLPEGVLLEDVSIEVTPPKLAPVQGYVPPAFDQRLAKLDVSGWVLDGVISDFPLVSPEGVILTPIADQYVTLGRRGFSMLVPGIDFIINGSQVHFVVPPVIGGIYWGHVQNPIVNGEQRDVFLDPPYSAFDAQAYLVAPENQKVAVVTRGGSAPMTYKTKLLAVAEDGQQREIRLDFAVKEP